MNSSFQFCISLDQLDLICESEIDNNPKGISYKYNESLDTSFEVDIEVDKK